MTHALTNDDFWSRIADINAGMLSIYEDRPVPMSHYADEAGKCLWFITAHGTQITKALETGSHPARYILAEGSSNLYATVDGVAKISNDKEKLDEIWNAVASAWFEEGEDDPDLVLIRLDLKEAEIWATNGGLAFFYEVAKANLTNTKPDIGTHGVLRFAA